MAIVTAQKQKTLEQKYLVPKKEYDLFQQWQKEVKDALKKVQHGRKEYKSDRTTIAPSPRVFR